MRLLHVLSFLWIVGSVIHAEEPNFSIAIVGNRQMPPEQSKDDSASVERPIIFLHPTKNEHSPLDREDQGTGEHFYVVITNKSAHPYRLNFSESAWFDSLTFTIVLDGETYRVHRPPIDWIKNSGRPWTFQPGETCVLTVNFATGMWEGLPKIEGKHRDNIRIKATFSGQNDGKWSFDSRDTEAMLF